MIPGSILHSLDVQANPEEPVSQSPELSPSDSAIHNLYQSALGFDLSCGLLIQPLCLNHHPQLQALNLRGNQLTEAPDLRHHPQLRSLVLAWNRLRQAPHLRHHPQLQLLDLQYNQLTQAPNLRHNCLLEELILARNLLTSTPNLRHNTHLKSLDLSQNQLIQAPDLSHNLLLQTLNLSQNQLSQGPNLSHHSQLRSLILWDNQLTEAPDLSNNSELQELDLARNQLMQAPDLSHHPQLRSLDLRHNQLTSLPDSILMLSSDCVVHVENNLFSEEYVTEFQARLAAHREAHPGQGPIVYMSVQEEEDQFSVEGEERVDLDPTLQQSIASWAEEIQTTFSETAEMDEASLQSLLNLSDEESEILSSYLVRIRAIEDYRQEKRTERGEPIDLEVRKNVIQRVRDMLELSCTNPSFKEKMLLEMSEGLENCRDRVNIVFDKIEIEWQLHQELSKEELRELYVRIARYDLLEKHAVSLRTSDPIETILAFHTNLRERLNLPITTKYVYFSELGYTGITPEQIEQEGIRVETLSNEELLAQSETWLEAQKARHPQAYREIHEEYGELLEQAGEFFGLDEAERVDFLTEHPTLATLLFGRKQDVANYVEASRFITEAMNREIANLSELDWQGAIPAPRR